jgi:uncharacterized protein YceK
MFTPGKPTKIYPASVLDAGAGYAVFTGEIHPIFLPCVLIDLPFSLVFDTLLLPYDVIVWDDDSRFKVW